MIDIKHKVDCCGCNACEDICPKDAITFKTDIDGVWYPKVDINKCIECHLCEKVCPIINPDGLNKFNSKNPTTWVLQHKDIKERFNSTSGCLYPEIARYFLTHNGYVAGHIFNDDYSVRGYVSNDLKDLELLRNSKYLQSDMRGIYKCIKKLLKEGNQVLFSGCPCQVGALKSYLKIDYPNLLTVDFTCMGIDSPKAFRKYIMSLENKYRSKVVYFKSKSKETGWRDLTNKFIFANGKTYFGTIKRDPNLIATFLNILVRPSCYNCKFKGFPRIADITIGDFWRKQSKEFDDIDDNTGTSYYIANNKKGQSLFEKIKDDFRYKKVNLELLFEGNPRMMTSLAPPSFNRDKFYQELETRDFSELVEDYYYRVHPKRILKPFLKNSLKVLKCVHLNPIAFLRFLYYNLFCSRVDANIANGDILITHNTTKLSLSKGSKIVVKGVCNLGRDSIIELNVNAKLIIDTINAKVGDVTFWVGNGGILSVGYRTVIANNVSISCSKKIDIGGFSYFSNNVSINDSNNNVVVSNDNALLPKLISIGEHCLLNENVVVKRGTQLGDEVIVEANSTVIGSFPPRVKIAGVPASIIDKNIFWKK